MRSYQVDQEQNDVSVSREHENEDFSFNRRASGRVELVSFAEVLLSDSALRRICDRVVGLQGPLDLCFRGCGLGTRSCGIIAELLCSHNNIVSLHLDWNCLGSSASSCKELFTAIGSAPALRYLDVRNNALSPLCAESLSHALANSQSLERVDARWNHLGQDAGPSLTRAVSDNRNLRTLLLAGNGISTQHLDEIDDILRSRIESQKRREADLQRLSSLERDFSTVKGELQKERAERQGTAREFNDTLATMKDSKNALEIDNKTLRREIESLEEIIAQKERTIEELKTVVASLESTMTKRRVEDKSRVDKLLLQLETTERKEESTLSRLSELERDIFEAREKEKSMSVELERTKRDVAHERRKLEETEKKLKIELEEEKRTCTLQLQSVEDRWSTLHTTKMKEMEMNIAEKVALLRTAEQRVADEKSIVIEIEKSYGDRLNSLEQANRELEGKLRAAEKRQLEDKASWENHLRTEVERVKRSGALQVETLEERIRGIIAARKTAEDDNEKLMTEIARLREDHVLAINEIEENNRKLEFDLRSCKSSLSDKDLKLQEAGKQIKQLESKLREKSVEIQDIAEKEKMRTDADREAWKKLEADLVAEIRGLQEIIQERNTRISRLQSTVSRVQQAVHPRSDDLVL